MKKKVFGVVRISSSNRITIPADVMRAAKLKAGDVMEWDAQGHRLTGTRVGGPTPSKKRA